MLILRVVVARIVGVAGRQTHLIRVWRKLFGVTLPRMGVLSWFSVFGSVSVSVVACL